MRTQAEKGAAFYALHTRASARLPDEQATVRR